MSLQNISNLADLNKANSAMATAWFMQCCTAEKWCQEMEKQRPFASLAALVEQAKIEWNKMQTEDFIQAFKGHPMIGDMSTLREKYANTKALASNEQSGTQTASETTLLALQKMNQEYLQKHGFIFIICASGLRAEAMLNELRERLPNTTNAEIKKAAEEQIKITLLRIHKAFSGDTK